MEKTQKSRSAQGVQFIDPFTEFGFKRNFGSNPRKDLLIAFLNDLFEGKKVIEDLHIDQSENVYPQLSSISRKWVYDVRRTSDDGSQFIIELFPFEYDCFKERAFFISSGAIKNQVLNESFSWVDGLRDVYYVGLLNFVFEPEDEDYYLHHIRACYRGTNTPFCDKFGHIFIELPKFRKSLEELESNVDRWLYILQNLNSDEGTPVAFQNTIFESAYRAADLSLLSARDRQRYIDSLNNLRDQHAVISAVENLAKAQVKLAETQIRNEGFKEGVNKGISEGKLEGIIAGKVEGKIAGLIEAKTDLIRNLSVQNRFSSAEIAELVSVSEDFIQEALSDNE